MWSTCPACSMLPIPAHVSAAEVCKTVIAKADLRKALRQALKALSTVDMAAESKAASLPPTTSSSLPYDLSQLACIQQARTLPSEWWLCLHFPSAGGLAYIFIAQSCGKSTRAASSTQHLTGVDCTSCLSTSRHAVPTYQSSNKLQHEHQAVS